MIDKSAWGHEEGNPANDNTDLHEELTPEQEFYNSEIDVPEHALFYITHLERTIKKMNEPVTPFISISKKQLFEICKPK